MSLINKIKAYSNTILALTDQAIVSGGNFVINILLARALGVDDYGIYALLWMVLLFSLSFNQAFITKPFLSLAPKKEADEKEGYVSHTHILQILFSILNALVIFVFLLIGEQFEITVPDPMIYSILPLLIGLHLMYDFYRRNCFVQNNLIRALILDGFMYILQFGGIFYLWQTESLSVTSALFVVGVAHVFVIILGFFFTGIKSFDGTAFKAVIQQHWDFAKWLVGTAALQWFSGNFFIIAAAAVLNTAAVGAVRIVQNVMGLTHVFFLAMENIVPVKAALHFKEGGKKQLYTYLKYITGRAGILVGGILLFVGLFANWIIGILYGEDILNNTESIGMSYQFIVIGYCLTYVLVFLAHPFRFALRTLENTKPIFIAYVIGAGFSMIAAYPMLQQYGMYGLLAGLFITQLLSQIVYFFYLKGFKTT